jgi:arylsulfatase A-like enzyme
MDDPRDVILVTVDSLRADHCGFMGYDGDTTPVLDEVAEDGLVFENAVAPAGATNGSTPVFMTGEYPVSKPDESVQERVRRHLEARENVAQRFQRRGYRTGAFTANPWTSRYFGYDAGFEDFEDFFAEDDETAREEGERRRERKNTMLSQVISWWEGQDMFMSWETFYDDVQEWLADAREDDRPYFLWLFLVDVHMPYLPPEGYRSQSQLRSYAGNAMLYAGKTPPMQDWFHDTLVTAYDDTIRYTDEFMDRLTRDVGPTRERGGEEDPLIVFHADHGESFGEDDVYGHGRPADEVFHVPLVVANGPSGRIESPTSLRCLPELTVGLATDDEFAPVETYDSPIAVGRTNQPSWLVRGRDWLYADTPHGERLERVGRERGPLENDDLRAVGRSVADQERESARERERILDATTGLGGDGET